MMKACFMAVDEVIKTGIEKLDTLLGGGIQRGFITCITGIPGTNIEIITKQIASTGDTLFITTDETQNEIMKTMKDFRWNTKNIEFVDIATEHLKYIKRNTALQASRFSHRSKKQIHELIKFASLRTPPEKTTEPNFLNTLLYNIQQFSSKKIVLDSLDFFLKKYAEEDVFKTLHAAKISLIEKKGIFIFSMTRGIHGENIEKELEQMADCVIELGIIQSGTSFERLLSIKKIRNRPETLRTARYDLSNEGIILETIERI